jgi:hypothetical protein
LGFWAVDNFSKDQIAEARDVPLLVVLRHVGAYFKMDPTYEPLDPKRKSYRMQVSFNGFDFRLVVTDMKWVDELVDMHLPNRGGGGAIDLVKYVGRVGFLKAVEICLDAKRASA